MSAVVYRCAVCRNTSADHDRLGMEWAKEVGAGGWGVPAIRLIQLRSLRGGQPVCDFCALDIAEAVQAREEARNEAVRSATPRPAITPAQRWKVWKRDNFTCRKCGAREQLAIDHVKPLALGGEHHERNMQTLCTPCNRSKGARV